MKPTQQEVLAYVTSTLAGLMEDWDDSDIELTPDTKLFTELGLESLDAVVLGATIQERYATDMPFGQMYAELGEQQRDITVKELAEFVYGQLNGAG